MFLPRVVSRLNLLSKVSGSLQNQSQALCSAVQHCHSTRFRALQYSNRCFISAADNKLPPKLWTPLEPELEEVLVPCKLSVSPLESWLSLRYSLPLLLEASPPLGKSMVLPPFALPLLEDGESSTPLNCKNVLQIRRRKMNRHKYKKLLKRTKFQRRRVKDVRRKKKQILQTFALKNKTEMLRKNITFLQCDQKAQFERDLTRIVRRAGLKRAPDGWTAPQVYVRMSQNKRN